MPQECKYLLSLHFNTMLLIVTRRSQACSLWKSHWYNVEFIYMENEYVKFLCLFSLSVKLPCLVPKLAGDVQPTSRNPHSLQTQFALVLHLYSSRERKKVGDLPSHPMSKSDLISSALFLDWSWVCPRR